MPLIAVTGTATRHYPAERAAVKVVISLEGKDRATVVEQASALHATVSTEARRQVEIGAATWWGADRVYASTHERYLKDSDVKVPYEVARANLTIRFQNFDKLADFVTNTAKLTGVSIGSIDWQLTESTKFTAEKAARMDAVRNALRNAADYASALGFPAPTLAAIYEPGLRPNSQIVGGAGTFSARAGGGQSSSSSAIALKPSDIEVSATITADFEATAPA